MRFDHHAPPLQLFVGILYFFLFHHFAGLEFTIAGIDDLDEIDHAPAAHLAVGRFDEPEFVDPRVARKGADQTDVRPFWRFNRTDTSIVRGVHVAHFESRAFSRKTARPKSRKTPLVRDFAEWVGLVHELRKLGTAEELANRGHNRLGVHQI